ncbi:MAG: hypothetical protein K0U98_00290 [Deltaproteobacteria bacterium]|nr:hypothetical protein [Deltaproteobacteria bacterium]
MSKGLGWRRWVLMAAVLCLVVLAVFTVLRLRTNRSLGLAAQEFRQAVGPVDLVELAPASVPPRRNAAHWLAKAMDFPKTASKEDLLDLRTLAYQELGNLGEEDLRRGKEILSHQSSTLEQLHRMEGLTSSSFDLAYDEGHRMEIPNLLGVLNCGRLLLLEARLALVEGEQQKAWRSLAAMRSLADAVYGEPMLIFTLIGAASERMLLLGVQDALLLGVEDPSSWYQLVSLPTGDRYQDRFRGALNGEGALAYWMAAHVDTGEGVGNSRGLLALGNPMHRVFTKRLVTAMLSHYSQVNQSYPLGSFAELRASSRLTRPSGERLFQSFGPDFELVAGRLKLNEAIGQVARLALGLAADGDLAGEEQVEASRSDPFTGQPLEIAEQADGSLVITLPEGTELWETVFPSDQKETYRLFRWVVPAPAELTVSAL